MSGIIEETLPLLRLFMCALRIVVEVSDWVFFKRGGLQKCSLTALQERVRALVGSEPRTQESFFHFELLPEISVWTIDRVSCALTITGDPQLRLRPGSIIFAAVTSFPAVLYP